MTPPTKTWIETPDLKKSFTLKTLSKIWIDTPEFKMVSPLETIVEFHASEQDPFLGPLIRKYLHYLKSKRIPVHGNIHVKIEKRFVNFRRTFMLDLTSADFNTIEI